MGELLCDDMGFDPVEEQQRIEEANIRDLDWSNFERVIREVLGSKELCDE